MAIIFLLGMSIIYKLYGLQVIEHDFYVAKANSQHKSENILIPERGKIFIKDGVSGESNIYPIATNKDFASLYVVPKDIKSYDEIVEIFYKYFNYEKVLTEVEEMFKKVDKERLIRDLAHADNLPDTEKAQRIIEITQKHEQTMKEPEFIEFRDLKKEKEIEDRKDLIIGDYLLKLTKNNDPYEPIESKVDDIILKQLYLELIKVTDKKLLFNSRNKLSDSAIDALIKDLTIDQLTIKDNYIIVETSDKQKRKLNIPGVGFFMKTHRYYPEKNIGSHLLGFVRMKDDRQVGRYGLEGFFNEELEGIPGSAQVDRGARGELIVINDMEYKPAQNGQDLILTIDRTIQYTICNTLNQAAEKHEADGASVIVVNPKTGAIISMCSWPDYDPNNFRKVEDIAVFNNPIIFNQYEPGSVFKTFTLAAAIDKRKVTPSTMYTDNGFLMIDGWPRPIKNSDYSTKGGHGVVDMNTVLEESLNTGSIFAMRQVGRELFVDYIKKFGFGEKSGIEINTEVRGSLGQLSRDKIYEIYAATASFGQGIMTTPLQLVSAYAALANNGILMKPYLVERIVRSEDDIEIIEPKEIRRVVSEKTAILIGGMLANVVEGGHAKLAGVEGYWVGGKTGTAQVASKISRGYGEETIHTFIGYAPIENPKFVMLVRIDNPKDVQYSASSAAPLFGKISEFLLDYWQVPRERE